MKAFRIVSILLALFAASATLTGCQGDGSMSNSNMNNSGSGGSGGSGSGGSGGSGAY